MGSPRILLLAGLLSAAVPSAFAGTDVAPPDAGAPPAWIARRVAALLPPPGGPAFREPAAISADPFGRLFVADAGNHRVVQYDADGRAVFEFGGYGWRDGQLSHPTDVCAREGFRLFVVDSGNERIQQFDIDDASAEGAAFPFEEGAGLGEETLVRPSRMDLDAEGRVYVADELCHCVWIFAPTGALVARWGGLGDAPTRFRAPAGVAVGEKGRVYVADAGNRRVQVFDSIGNWVATWTGPADDPLVEPAGIDVGPDGRVWVADAGAGRVRAFTPEGFPVLSFDGGPGDGAFRAPCDVEAVRGSRVWVVDRERGTVEGFRVEQLPAGAR